MDFPPAGHYTEDRPATALRQKPGPAKMDYLLIRHGA